MKFFYLFVAFVSIQFVFSGHGFLINEVLAEEKVAELKTEEKDRSNSKEAVSDPEKVPELVPEEKDSAEPKTANLESSQEKTPHATAKTPLWDPSVDPFAVVNHESVVLPSEEKSRFDSEEISDPETEKPTKKKVAKKTSTTKKKPTKKKSGLVVEENSDSDQFKKESVDVDVDIDEDLKQFEKDFKFLEKHLEKESKKIKNKNKELIETFASIKEMEQTISKLKEDLRSAEDNPLINLKKINKELTSKEKDFLKKKEQFEKDFEKLNKKRDEIALLKKEITIFGLGKPRLKKLRDIHFKKINSDPEIDFKVKELKKEILQSLSQKERGSLKRFNDLIQKNKGLFISNPERAWYLLTKFFNSRKFNKTLKSVMVEQVEESEFVKTKTKTLALASGLFGFGDVWILSSLMKAGLISEMSADNPLVAFNLIDGIPDTLWVAIPAIAALTGLSYGKYLSSVKKKTLVSKAVSLIKAEAKRTLCEKSFAPSSISESFFK